MASLSYNGFAFSDIQTTNLDQQPKFTKDGVEYLHDEYVVRVKSIFDQSAFSNTPLNLAGTATTGFAPGIAGEAPSVTYRRLMGCLSRPRQTLIFSDAGGNILTSPSAGATTDANWGPKVTDLKITSMTPTTWMIEFEVKTWIHNCCASNPNGSTLTGQANVNNSTAYIANRWSESVNYNDEFYATVTRDGTLYFRADTLQAAANFNAQQADFYRSVCVAACPMRNGFMRTESKYSVSEDGLTITYSITDKQVYCMPLAPAVKVEATYKTNAKMAQIFEEEVVCKAYGPPLPSKVTKSQLFQVCAQMAMSRLDEQNRKSLNQRNANQPVNNQGQKTNRKVINVYEWQDNMMENWVQLRIKTFGSIQFNKTFYGTYLNKNDGLVPVTGVDSGDPTKPPNPNVYGFTAMQLVSAILCDPCLQKTCANMPNVSNVPGVRT